MMPLSRFAALAASYGGDIGRWPEACRDNARALAAASPEAGRLLAEAARLDTALLGAGKDASQSLMPPGTMDAALERLRQNVAARLPAKQPMRQASTAVPARLAAWLAPRLPVLPRLAGLATAGGVAVMAGLLIGALTVSQPDGDALLALMQPSPLAIWAE